MIFWDEPRTRPVSAVGERTRPKNAVHRLLRNPLCVAKVRVTELMDLLLLGPEVQEEVLFLELPPDAPPVSERGLREAALGTIGWQEQRRRSAGLRAQFAPAILDER